MAGNVSNWVETTNVTSYGGRKTVTYFLCQDKAALLYLINMGCIELNVWLSHVPTILVPNYAVIDIDPGNLAFSKVISSARIIQRLFEKLEIESFCKTSGGRGIHIYLATDGKAAFSDCQKFAELVGKFLKIEMPGNTSLDRSPLVRRDKIYIDALQNRKGQTMASIYCVRPRVGGTVSTPIKRSGLTTKLDPAKFTLKTIPARLAKGGDLWAKINNVQHDILALNKILAGIIEGRKS